jgi:ASC-1-like (ASCH) protein
MAFSALPRVPCGSYAAAASVADIPVLPGAYYGVDIDDTLIKTTCTRGKYHSARAIDGRAAEWTRRVAEVARLEYITARAPETARFTAEQLAALGFADAPIHTTGGGDKYPHLEDALAVHAVVVFVDDNHAHIDTVSRRVPAVTCVRLSRRLHARLSSDRCAVTASMRMVGNERMQCRKGAGHAGDHSFDCAPRGNVSQECPCDQCVAGRLDWGACDVAPGPPWRLALHSPWFEQVRDGAKHIDLRLALHGMRKIAPGDEVEYAHAADASMAPFSKTVLDVSEFVDFADAIDRLGEPKSALPDCVSQRAALQTLEGFAAQETQALYGVLAIELV